MNTLIQSKYIDMHTHSTESDGTLTPAELIKLAARTGLAAIALTDHDTVSGLPKARAAAEEYGIELIPGIELSTEYDKTEVHILGYFIDDKNSDFLQELCHFRNGREIRNRKMTEKLQNEGFDIAYEKLLESYPNSIITRAHFARYLVEHDMVKDRDTVFRKYLGNGCRCYVPREKITLGDAIRLIRKGGGAAYFAHPVLCRMNPDRLNAFVGMLKEQGLTGIEAVYSTYLPGEERRIRMLAEKYGLLMSGGSDFHGSNKPSIQLGTGKGNLRIPYTFLAELKAVLRL